MEKLKVFNNIGERAMFYAEVLSVSLLDPSAASDMLAQKNELEEYVQEKNEELEKGEADVMEMHKINRALNEGIIAAHDKMTRLEAMNNRRSQLANTLVAISKKMDPEDPVKFKKILELNTKILNRIQSLEDQMITLEGEILDWFKKAKALEHRMNILSGPDL